MIVSRPKTVMNHGIPAAGSLPSPTPPCSRIRSEARSATDCANACSRSSHSRGAAGRGAATPRASRGRARARRRSAARRAAARLLAVDERDDVELELPRLARLELDRVADPAAVRLAALREDHLRPRAVGVGEHELVVLVVVAPARPAAAAPRAIGSPSAKSCALTVMMSAKSLPNSSPSSNETGSMLSFRTTIGPASPRRRSARARSRACPAAGRRRAGCGGRTPPRSTRPSTREQQRPLAVDRQRSTERKRVSCAKKPLVSSPTSPRSSQMQNVEPSRIVSVTSRAGGSGRRTTARAP